MKVVIVGGKLQGVEIVYLAQKAGWETYLVDRKTSVPACGICDYYSTLDICEDQVEFLRLLEGKDIIFPAFEDGKTLEVLSELAKKAGVPLVLDLKSYGISSSKLTSDHLFAEHNIPAPRYWPNCPLPVIAKPSGLSGSVGVRLISDTLEMKNFEMEIAAERNAWVIQEYLTGPSYSLEVIGCHGKYLSLQPTEIIVDRMYDCQRVEAPLALSVETENELRQISEELASILKLEGIMDVEVIDTGRGLRVLEIDARFPSQTPITVYHSTGVNMVEILASVFVRGELASIDHTALQGERHVIFEHICVTPDGIETLGEHIMTVSGPLSLKEGFFGADEALTSYSPGRTWWVATLIITGSDKAAAWAKRQGIIKNIEDEFDLKYLG